MKINITRKIKEAYPEIIPDSLHFESVTLDDVKKEVLNLNPKKSFISWAILITFLKLLICIYII